MVSKKTTPEVSIEDRELRDYELLLIISPEVVDEALEAQLEKINQMVGERGGTVTYTDQWGKRKLAYPVEHFLEGNYVLLGLKFDPTQCEGLEARLRISEQILRVLLIKVGG
ncbi:30S ribosomal protein S6 [Chloroflexota bacterium]